MHTGERFNEVSELVFDLLRRSRQSSGPLYSYIRRIFVVSRRTPMCYIIANDFKGEVEQVAILDSVSEMPLRAEAFKSIRIAFVVDLDSFGSIDECFGSIYDFRRCHPEAIVILLSGNFARDDFGNERLWVADASIRFPMRGTSPAEIVSLACLNNIEWRQRLKFDESRDFDGVDQDGGGTILVLAAGAVGGVAAGVYGFLQGGLVTAGAYYAGGGLLGVGLAVGWLLLKARRGASGSGRNRNSGN